MFRRSPHLKWSLATTKRLATVLAVTLLVALPARPGAADEIADKRAEAQRIASQLQAESNRESELAERYNAARLEAEQVEGKTAAAAADVARLDALLVKAKEQVRAQAVEAYIHGGISAQAGQLLGAGTDLGDLTRRQQYVETLLRSQREAIAELRQVRGELDERQAALAAARSEARAALAVVDSSRRSASEAEAARRATLAQVQGELATLVNAETRRRAEDDARRAMTEQAARSARDQTAARTAQAAPTSAPTRGGNTTTTTKGKSPAPDAAPAGPSAPPASGASAAVAKAKEQIGKPYKWGAEGPDSFDCSGLTLYAWRAGGRSLPHSSRAQYSATARVSTSALQPGDLLFYGNPIHHVGIYVGNGQMVEASETGTPVRYASIWRSDMVGAGRVY